VTDLAGLHDAYIDAWMRDDAEAAMSYWADDIVMHAAGSNPHSGTYRGKAEVRRNLIDRIYAETAKAEVLGVDDRAIGRDHVFTVVHERFEKADGRTFETHRIVVYRWTAEKIVEVSYFDANQAEADAFWSEAAQAPPR
jgi:ketosteroid isomerase-like protein